jgi:flagellar hook-length control protein FliK
LASLATQAIASGAAQNPVAAAKTSASGAASIDAVFASLLAKPDVAPSRAQNSDPAVVMAQAGAAKDTQDLSAQLLGKPGKTKSAGDNANDNDANPALAALASQMNAAQPVATPKSTASAVEALALEKLAKKPSAFGDSPALPLPKAGTPTLPVIAPGDGQGEATKQASAAISATPSATDDQTKAAGTAAAALSDGARQTARQSAPAQVTESQALSIHFDASAAKSGDGQTQNGHSGGGSAHEQTQTQHAEAPVTQSSQTPPPVQAPAPIAANAAPAAAASADGAASIASAATAAGVSGPATSSNVGAVLQVAPQSDSTAPAAAQPNLQALAVTIAAKSTDGFKQFDIRLDPPELGRIDVRLSVDDTGKAQAHLAADNVQTLQLLQRDSSTLERSLRDSGLDLANNGLNFSLKGQERQDGNAPNSQTRGRALSVTAVAAPATSASNYSLAPDGVTLDIRV